MKTWIFRLALSLMGVVGFCTTRLPAQQVIAPAGEISVMPAAPYEPAQPPQYRSAAITPASAMPIGLAPITIVGFQEPGDATAKAPPVDFKEPANPDAYRFWARTEYLLWWVTGAPVGVPLVTTGPPGSIGALNEPGTKILFGAGSGQEVNFGAFSGLRASVGGWIDNDYEFSWECTGFLLENRSFVFNAASAGGAAPIVSIPFNATQPFNLRNPAGETSLNAGGAPSNASVRFTSQLWGAEVNELVSLYGTERFYWGAVLGFRYLDLRENLTLTYSTFDAGNNATLAVTDGFGTRNQIYTGQIGTRLGVSLDRWEIDTTATVAFGGNHQVVNIAGAATVTNGAFGFANGTTPGGVFAQPSNIGSHSHDVFVVVPEVRFKVAFALTPRIRPFIAYNVLYLSNVARPGNQIDRNINPTQNAFFVPPGTLSGTAAPLATTIRDSDFWAHGVQIGLEIRF